MLDSLIIGGGPAGLTAGIYLMRAGLSCALYEKQFCGGQAATTNWIENYPGFPDGIGGPELSMAMAEQAQKLGLEIRYDEITELHLTDTERYAIAGGKRIDARTVVLCMGATPRPLGLAEEERLRGRGVSYCATCDGAFFRGKEVCVVGGGDTAMEDALYLARFAPKVTIIHRRDSFRAAQALVRRVQQTPNVKILYRKSPQGRRAAGRNCRAKYPQRGGIRIPNAGVVCRRGHSSADRAAGRAVGASGGLCHRR